MASEELMQKAKTLLKQYFGHESFRKGQKEIISELLDGRDVLGVMPTGAGKSMCYQIPALMADGVTIVVSPLISLMNDQVSALVQAGIRGAYYNSSLNDAQCRKALHNMYNGMYKIIYVAPERLETESFVEVCKSLNISYLAIDEAHCVSQWGQDFRPSYLKIMGFVDKLPKRPVIGAFTATATTEVKDDISRILRLNNPYTITTGFDRPNLYFEIRRPKTMQQKFDSLRSVIDEHKDKSGIIYCSTRKTVDELYEKLLEFEYPVTKYHAGLSPEERNQNQTDFIYDRRPIVIATNAFGMGIDKSNVSYVVHYNMPKNIENYYQEAGRAGRDGSDADCVLLYMPKDIHTIKYFIEREDENSELTPEQRAVVKERDLMRMNKMIHYCQMSGCIRNYILYYFGEKTYEQCNNCSGCNGEVYMPVKTVKKREFIDFDDYDTRSSIGGGFYDDDDDWGEEENIPKKPLPLKKNNKNYEDVDKELFDQLRYARLKVSKERGIPPYIIFSDRTIRDICIKKPKTKAELLNVDGIGQQKADTYGDMIIGVIKKYADKKPAAVTDEKKIADMIRADFVRGLRPHVLASKYNRQLNEVLRIIREK